MYYDALAATTTGSTLNNPIFHQQHPTSTANLNKTPQAQQQTNKSNNSQRSILVANSSKNVTSSSLAHVIAGSSCSDTAAPAVADAPKFKKYKIIRAPSFSDINDTATEITVDDGAHDGGGTAPLADDLIKTAIQFKGRKSRLSSSLVIDDSTQITSANSVHTTTTTITETTTGTTTSTGTIGDSSASPAPVPANGCIALGASKIPILNPNLRLSKCASWAGCDATAAANLFANQNAVVGQSGGNNSDLVGGSGEGNNISGGGVSGFLIGCQNPDFADITTGW